MALFWQAKPFEPGHQVPGQLRDQQPRPVRVKEFRRHFFKAEIVFVFFDQIFHRATAQGPLHQFLCAFAPVVGDHHMVAPDQPLLLIFDLLALDHVTVRLVTSRSVLQFGDLSASRITLPGRLRQCSDLLHQTRRLIGGDGVSDLMFFAKLNQVPNVKLAVGAQKARQVCRCVKQSLFEKPDGLRGSARVAGLEVRVQQLQLFGPKGKQRVIPDLALVIHPGTLFALGTLFVKRTIQINRQTVTLLPLSDALGGQTIDSPKVAQFADVEAAQKFARRRRSHQRFDSEQFRQARIATQHIKVAHTIAPQNRIPAEAQNILRFGVSAFTSFDIQFVINQLWKAQTINKIPHQNHSRFASQGLSAETDIELKGFANYIRIHLTGDSFRTSKICTTPRFYALMEPPVTDFKEP